MTTWHDEQFSWPVTRHESVVDVGVFGFLTDTVTAPDGASLQRSYLRHPGAVAVVALDQDHNVVVLHQYRHPVGMRMVELPAGLTDVAGEDWLLAAQRELAEEALLAADDWRVLVDFCCSPGSTQESIRVFLARGLHATARPEGFVVEGEEADMAVSRVPLAELVAAIFSGQMQNPALVIGVLALWAARDDLDALRPADAPWLARQAREAADAALGA